MSWGDIFTTVHIRTPPTWWLTYKLQLRREKGKRPPVIVLGDILVGKCLSIFNLSSFIWSRCTWMPLFTLTVGLYQRPLVARQYGPHELSPLNVIGALTPLVINLIFSTHSTHTVTHCQSGLQRWSCLTVRIRILLSTGTDTAERRGERNAGGYSGE